MIIMVGTYEKDGRRQSRPKKKIILRLRECPSLKEWYRSWRSLYIALMATWQLLHAERCIYCRKSCDHSTFFFRSLHQCISAWVAYKDAEQESAGELTGKTGRCHYGWAKQTFMKQCMPANNGNIMSTAMNWERLRLMPFFCYPLNRVLYMWYMKKQGVLLGEDGALQ